ncbi:MAG: hypothetical protein OHK0024_04240 [Thalassobaculales bacterium]
MRDRLDTSSDWHSLFDALCIEQGHLDNARLAGRYCDIIRRSTQGAYESAVKNLSNWRQGVHTPSRRNFRALTLLLGIDGRPELRERWNSLYEEARRRKPAADEANESFDETAAPITLPAPHEPPAALAGRSWRGRRWGRPAAAAALGALVFAGAATLGPMPWTAVPPPAADPVMINHPPSQIGAGRIDMTGQPIVWLQFVRLKVGDSAVIHGRRADNCGEQPPSWEDVLGELPDVPSGEWSDGGIGLRVSRACKGATPARAVVFTALRPGSHMIVLYDDPVTIIVDEF